MYTDHAVIPVTKTCFCIGPDKCKDPCCPQVQFKRKQNEYLKTHPIVVKLEN